MQKGICHPLCLRRIIFSVLQRGATEAPGQTGKVGDSSKRNGKTRRMRPNMSPRCGNVEAIDYICFQSFGDVGNHSVVALEIAAL